MEDVGGLLLMGRVYFRFLICFMAKTKVMRATTAKAAEIHHLLFGSKADNTAIMVKKAPK